MLSRMHPNPLLFDLLKKKSILLILFEFWQKTNKYCFQTKAEAYLAVNSAPEKEAVGNIVPIIRIFLTVFIVRNIP